MSLWKYWELSLKDLECGIIIMWKSPNSISPFSNQEIPCANPVSGRSNRLDEGLWLNSFKRKALWVVLWSGTLVNSLLWMEFHTPWQSRCIAWGGDLTTIIVTWDIGSLSGYCPSQTEITTTVHHLDYCIVLPLKTLQNLQLVQFCTIVSCDNQYLYIVISCWFAVRPNLRCWHWCIKPCIAWDPSIWIIICCLMPLPHTSKV